VELTPVILDIETTGLDPFSDRIVAIGVQRGEDVRVFINKNELRVIWDFFEFLTAVHKPLETQVLVGYNIHNFDLPFITTRAIKHGLTVDAGYLRKMYRADLMTIVTRYLNTRNRNLSLKTIAEFLGIRVNDAISGSDIPVLWEKGDFDAIAQHCLSDIYLTQQLLKRLKYLVEHNIERRYEIESVSLGVDA